MTISKPAAYNSPTKQILEQHLMTLEKEDIYNIKGLNNLSITTTESKLFDPRS